MLCSLLRLDLLPFPTSVLCQSRSRFGSSVSLSLLVLPAPLSLFRSSLRPSLFPFVAVSPALLRKSRYFRLVGYVLSYYESRESLAPVLGGVHLNSTLVKAEPDSLFGMPFTFSITQTQAEQRTYYCVANDKEEMEEWSVHKRAAGTTTTTDAAIESHVRIRACTLGLPSRVVSPFLASFVCFLPPFFFLLFFLSSSPLFRIFLLKQRHSFAPNGLPLRLNPRVHINMLSNPGKIPSFFVFFSF